MRCSKEGLSKDNQKTEIQEIVAKSRNSPLKLCQSHFPLSSSNNQLTVTV